ncbi:hypothetical protein QCE48_15825 [Caballeronia sp. LZ024]|nr:MULTISPECIES: hypothetical protein [unclassified Caballeronia]MDR5752253.1 hypothetical protein [Caballeronia sp. LZ024]MDR5841771.1 hypothetical protein [Caballeronia sp. LZ031]
MQHDRACSLNDECIGRPRDQRAHRRKSADEPHLRIADTANRRRRTRLFQSAVAAIAQDLCDEVTRAMVDSRSLQHEPVDRVWIAHREVGEDLTAE